MGTLILRDWGVVRGPEKEDEEHRNQEGISWGR